MPRYFKKARQINNLKVIEAAEKLGISQPTLSAWEGERKSPSVEGLEKMSDLYGVTTDFLLGRFLQSRFQFFTENRFGPRSMVGCWSTPSIIL